MGVYAQGAGDKEFLEGKIEDKEDFDEEAGDEEDSKGIENGELSEDSDIETSCRRIGNEGALDDEKEREEHVEDETCNRFFPQSLWPLSPAFWHGTLPEWEQGLSPFSQPVDHDDSSNYFGEPTATRPQRSVAAGQHARGGRAHISMSRFLLESPTSRNQHPATGSPGKHAEEISSSSTYRQYSIAKNGYSPLLPGPPGLATRGFEVKNQNSSEARATCSRQPVTVESRPQASQEQGAAHRGAAVGEARSSQQPSNKKDSRGWEEHEKAFVKILMEEIISEGEHDRTEERWRVISRRLMSRYSVNRTWSAVKNWWNRCGRSDSNIDERQVKKPDRMITGKYGC